MDGVTCEYVTNSEDTNDQRSVETTHSCYKEDNTVNRIDLRILETFDMSSAGPTHLLKEPSEKCGRGIGRGERGGVEGYFPVLKEEIRG